MANSSSFPTTIDSFLQRHEIQASDVPAVQRFQELKLKSSRTPSEETELANLTTQLRDKLISSDDFNKFQDALVNMEVFIRDNVETYIDNMQAEVLTTKDAALVAIEQKKENVIAYMDGTTAGAIRNDMGDLTTLITTDKSSLVAAVNEVKGQVGIPIAYGVTSGTNTYTVAPSPSLVSYVDGSALSIKIGTTNTGASTINVNGLGAKNILDSKGNAMTAGKLRATSIYTLRYNGTDFILQGEGGYGNAASSDLLSGKTASTDVGDITGTMPNNGAVNRTPSNVAQNIPSGFTTGGTVDAVVVPAANVLTGTTIAGTPGSMPNRGAVIITPSTIDQLIALGFHDGTGKVIGDPDLIAANILNIATIFGIQGSAVAKKFANGSAASNADASWTQYNNTASGVSRSITVSGLSFTPVLILAFANTAPYMTIWNNGTLFYSPSTVPSDVICTSFSTVYNLNLASPGQAAGYVNATGFKIPVVGTQTATWLAFG